MSDLQPIDGVLVTAEPNPRTRIRIEHSKTIKEGWGYSTTVEIVYPDYPQAIDGAMTVLEELVQEARRIGETERDMRNAREDTRHAE